VTLVQFAIINLGALITAAGGIFLKRLSEQLDHSLPLTELAIHALKSSNFWSGGFCYIFPIFLWTYLLKHMELTKLQPLLSVAYVYSILLSMMLLGENPPAMRLFGIAMIIAGVVFVGRS
jgi:multidrug transporter EmrE-like cation transporter